MREFKFRGWDERNKIMHYSFQFIESLPSEENGCLIFTSDKQLVTTEWINNPYFRQQLKIMQYTGLKDKNGKEIYEGDILKGDHTYALEVFWRNDRASFYFTWFMEKGRKMKIRQEISEIMENYDLEVIGNIYENPELMEGK